MTFYKRLKQLRTGKPLFVWGFCCLFLKEELLFLLLAFTWPKEVG